MDFVSFPTPDRGLPNSVQLFRDFTKNIYHEIAGGKNTVIHCRAGIGCTGIVAAGILLHCGFEPDEAFKLISEKPGVQVPDTPEQREWIESNHSAIVTST